MPCGCGNPECAERPAYTPPTITYVVGNAPAMPPESTWFASLGIGEVAWCIHEWDVRFPETGARWVGADGEARTTCIRGWDDTRSMVRPAGGWLFGDLGTEEPAPTRPTLTLTPTTVSDPGPAVRIAPPRRRDVRRNEDDDETTCADCENDKDDCECVECTNCDNRGPDVEICSVCETCMDECCECVECNRSRCNWRGPEGDRCEVCEQCQDHCECYICEGCDERVRSTCNDCSRCPDCCEGHASGEHPTYVNRRLVFHDARRGKFQRNPSKRHLAVEIEVAGCKDDDFSEIERSCRRWGASITEDGSLPAEGFEIPTAPANGDAFCQQIVDICGAIKGARGFVDESCGLHVHVDARDYRHYDMRRLVLLYAKLEEAFYALHPESRKSSGYCDPCGARYIEGLLEARTAKESKHTLMGNVYRGKRNGHYPSGRYDQQAVAAMDAAMHEQTRKGKAAHSKTGTFDSRPVKTKKYSEVRYHALNLHSWVYRGTVEFRLHTGSIEPRKIIPWGAFLAALLDYAMRAKESEIRALTFDTLNEAQAFMHDVIAPTEEVREYLRDRWQRFGHAYDPALSDYALLKKEVA